MHHVRLVLAVLLDPDLSDAVRLRKLDKLIQRIAYDLRQAEKARCSHTWWTRVVRTFLIKLKYFPIHLSSAFEPRPSAQSVYTNTQVDVLEPMENSRIYTSLMINFRISPMLIVVQ